MINAKTLENIIKKGSIENLKNMKRQELSQIFLNLLCQKKTTSKIKPLLKELLKFIKKPRNRFKLSRQSRKDMFFLCNKK
jgi:hypothetical protein